MNFRELSEKVNKLPEDHRRVLALDPGETTGFAYFMDRELITSGQLPTGSTLRAVPILEGEIFDEFSPDVIVCEEYRIYQWRAKHHAGSDLHTARLIGVIECLCVQQHIPIRKQSAHIAKEFCTDAKLKDWGMYVAGQRHARDAIRHACYYQIFGPSVGKKKSSSHKVG